MSQILKISFISLISLLLMIPNSAQALLRDSPWSAPPEGRLKKSFWDSVQNKRFYLTFGAGVLALTLLDGEVSRFATRENPLFGSGETADTVSDIMIIGMVPLMFYTAFQTWPKKDKYGRTVANKFSRIAMMTSILAINYMAASIIKGTSGRLRPDGSDTLSLPSGHASITSGMATIINKNINNSRFAGTSTGTALKITSLSLASLTAWARVEASKHHLSDVLLGHALGHFFSDFLYNTFLEKRVVKEDILTNYLYLHPEKMELGLSLRF